MSDSLLALFMQPWILIYQLFQYIFKGTGWLLAPIVETAIFVSPHLFDKHHRVGPLSKQQLDPTDPSNIPLVEIMVSPVADPGPAEFQRNKGVFAFLVTLLKPKSAGTIRLSSSDPGEEPLCNLNFLSDANDLQTLRDALCFCINLKEEMKKLGYPLVDALVPTSKEQAVLDTFIRKNSDSLLHYGSSCRMAPEDDPRPGVVDDELRVHGIPNLRIADASVFPNVPATHLQAPVVMIAEKCADMIKKDAWPMK